MSLDCTNCASCGVQEQEKYPLQTEFIYDPKTYSRPLAMMLGLTNDCTLACPYCFVTQSPANMSLETAEQAVNWLLNNYREKVSEGYSGPPPTVNFFGGEPTMRFNAVIKPLVEKYYKEISFGITTNGTLLNEDVIDFFYKYQIGPLLSFDGVPVVQNSQRPGKGFDSFETILKNIPYLLLRFPGTTMRSTITATSIPYLYESVLMGEELGFQSIAFCPNAFEEWGLEEEEELYCQFNKIGLHIYKGLLDSSKDTIIKVSPFTRQVVAIDNYFSGNLFFNNSLMRCGLGTTSCAITPTGEIIPCQEKTSNPTTILGNVYSGINACKHESFLKNYFTLVNAMNCSKTCSPDERRLCFSDTCPSRLEDQNFKISSSVCTFTRTSAAISSRLHSLFAYSINPYIRNYFGLGGPA